MGTKRYQAFMNLGKEVGLTGKDLADWIKEELDDLAKKEREERTEQRKYAEEQRQYEVALKEKELEKVQKESAKALATQQPPTPHQLCQIGPSLASIL